MENNLNDKHKRVRKRIIVKRDPASGPPDSPLPRINYNNNSDGPFQNFKSYSPAPFDKPVNRSNKPYNKDRSGFGQDKKRFNSKPGFKKPFVEFEDPTSKHQFFTRHEKNKTPRPQEPLSPPVVRDENQLIRLNKFISNAGICSRREADELITKGTVSVNGKVITELGFKVNPKDIVEYRGKRISEANHVYILLNKPKDTITTTNDPANRPTVMDLVQKATEQRIFPIGRLDRNTTGVILLTNDGDFAQKLSHPSSEVKKVYYAILDKPLEREHFEKLVEGVVLEDGPMNVDEIAYVDDTDKTMIGVEIHSGKNRIVHRLFEHLGYIVKKLDRVVYAGLDKGGLRRSKWRFLRYDEVQTVLNSIKYYDDKSA